jgi:hypothetical protein
MARSLISLSVALTALAAIAFPAAAQAPSPAQCPDQISDTISGSQIAACLRDLRSARTESQRGASEVLQVITCKISGRRPQAGEWTFGFGNRSCDKPIDEFDVVSGWLVQSDVCGGLENYAIGISPPSITLAGVKSCFDQESSVSVSYLVRARK